ncbi:ABC transporter substrate-binding protein [Terasakiispira papahanaumokuakeensis]|uniref:ABC transporter substrate-binding protein n=1 Tax=Terasakiispira papahanaumokuakeensis TaxID=197479 RepID=A0A1E2V5E7_9GAMM|nr:acyclic terpene utilization AtuA family protein [Terasakiispira papahanaumokuakeensis]ODC02198.1 ABC transporter substrate-binding protein [Terasakiispira papahanaumokuakeensis]
MKTVRIGSGAGYAGDRIEPAVELARYGNIRYLGFECLAERTIALAQQARQQNPALGYDPLLKERMRAVLPICQAQGITVISNMGAANPAQAAIKTQQIAQSLGLTGLKIAYVTGDDVLSQVQQASFRLLETGEDSSQLNEQWVSANAYLGAAPIVEALAAGADVILTGRVADPALFAAPLIYEFGWSMSDWHRMGQATLVGHLLECAGQVTGGYFADPGMKDVSNLACLGFPIAEVNEAGSAVITKVPGSGGQVTLATCKEQLLYEIHDPACYLTPDVQADFSQVTMRSLGEDRVEVSGATGHPRPETLKVSMGYREGFIGEGQMSYGGPGAQARGRLALEIIQQRLMQRSIQAEDIRCDLIGHNALLDPCRDVEPNEVRMRVAVRTDDPAVAASVGREVEALYTNGPAGGGGASRSVREVLAVASLLLPRQLVTPEVNYLTV